MSDIDNDKIPSVGLIGPNIAIAKLSMPRTAKGVIRPRLHALLDGAFQSTAAMWIVAPGGAGKTTLAATYIEEQKLPFLWYQMDKDDADPATFFYYLGLAAKQLQPTRDTFLPLLTTEYLHDIPGFTRRYFRHLFSLLPRETVVVLDNYQNIGDAPVLNELLHNAIGEVPESCKIIVISRRPPPQELVRLQVINALRVIVWEDLCLRYDETELIANRHCTGLSSKFIRTLHKLSDGWVAGLILLLQQVEDKTLQQQPIEPDAREEVFEFFANEVFNELPGTTRDFLLQTSLLSHITPGLAAELTENRQADKILEDLHRQHFFTSRRNLSEFTYQYHALFREFLRTRLSQEYSRKRYVKLMHHAGSLLEKYGRRDEAIDIYLQVEAWPDAIALILALAPLLLEQSRAAIIANWIQRIPKEKVIVSPCLLYWQGLSQQFVNPFEARATLEQAYAGFADVEDIIGQLSAASAIIDIMFFLRESLRSAAPWIEVLEKYLTMGLNIPSPVIEAKILSSLFSVLKYLRSQDPTVMRCAERLMILLDSDLEINQKVVIGAHLLNYYAHTVGDISNCERIICRINPLLSSPHVTVVNRIIWRCFCVLPCLLNGKDDAAYESVRPLLAHVEDNNLPFMESIASFYTLLALLFRGEMRAAQPLLERMSLVVNNAQPVDVAWLYTAKCWYALAQCDYAAALNYGQASLQAIDRVGATLIEMDISCLLALVCCESGKFDRAMDFLASPRKLLFANNPRLRHQVSLVEAYVYLQKGNQLKCYARLRESFAIGREQCYFGSLYCWIPNEVMVRLCSEALRSGIEVDYTQRLILKRGLQSDDPNLEAWPWPIKIHTLGQFKVLIDGQTELAESVLYSKSITLLKLLIAIGGMGVKEQNISGILWPDAEGDAAHSAFSTTLSRLRKLIGHNAIIIKHGRLNLNRARCWVDVWCFDYLINRFNMPGISLNTASARALAGKIVTIYKGHFLREEEEAWAEEVRQRLQSRYFRFLLNFGRMMKKNNCGEELALPPLTLNQKSPPNADVFYLGIMTSFAAAGMNDAVLEAFTSGCAMFPRILEIIP